MTTTKNRRPDPIAQKNHEIKELKARHFQEIEKLCEQLKAIGRHASELLDERNRYRTRALRAELILSRLHREQTQNEGVYDARKFKDEI